MKSTFSLVCAVLSVVAPLSAQNESKPAAASEAAAKATPQDLPKVSYAIGSQIGANISQNLKSQEIEVDLDTFLQGMRDQFEGKEPKYKMEELRGAMETFQKHMQAKAEARMTPEERAELAKQRAEEEAAMKEMAGRAAVAKQEGQKFLADNGKRKEVTTTASGLQYEILKKGDGPKPKVTDRVNVHYHGTLLSGKVFDSSVERNMPIVFGVQEVIKGWTEVLQLMPVGSKWKVFIPSDLAYGPSGAPPSIGPDETLVFEVELIGIEK